MWTELRKSAKCKRCGTPLILPDGRRVDEATAAPPVSSMALAPAGGMPSPPTPLFSGGQIYSLPTSTGTDWVAVARWITIGYGALVVIGTIAFGLLVRHITVPVQDPDTGRIVNQTLDVGAFFVFAAAILAVIFAVFAWLAQFTVARIILLLLTVLAALGALARMSEEPPSAVVGSLVSVLFDAGFAFVLVMSIISRPRTDY
jgi:hypothetical protein